jgi:hypothetical protein
VKAGLLTGLGVLWLGGVAYLVVRLWRIQTETGVGFGIDLPLPKWVPHDVAFLLTIAVLVVILLGWTIPLAAGLGGLAKRD